MKPRLLAIGLAGAAPSARRSTAAFCGTVIAVADPAPNERDHLKKFTVRIESFDYISWGKFGRDSKTGETITLGIRKIGTVRVLDGH